MSIIRRSSAAAILLLSFLLLLPLSSSLVVRVMRCAQLLSSSALRFAFAVAVAIDLAYRGAAKLRQGEGAC